MRKTEVTLQTLKANKHQGD